MACGVLARVRDLCTCVDASKERVAWSLHLLGPVYCERTEGAGGGVWRDAVCFCDISLVHIRNTWMFRERLGARAVLRVEADRQRGRS